MIMNQLIFFGIVENTMKNIIEYFLLLTSSHHFALNSIDFLVLILPYKSIRCLDWTLWKGHLVKLKVGYFGLFDNEAKQGVITHTDFSQYIQNPSGITSNQLFI